eukprot:1954072-Rhodomonas_salina.2
MRLGRSTRKPSQQFVDSFHVSHVLRVAYRGGRWQCVVFQPGLCCVQRVRACACDCVAEVGDHDAPRVAGRIVHHCENRPLRSALRPFLLRVTPTRGGGGTVHSVEIELERERERGQRTSISVMA